MRVFKLHDGRKGVALTVRLTPRSRRTEIAGVRSDGTLRVRVTSRQTEDKANDELLGMISDLLGIGIGSLEVVAGENSLDKIVSVLDMSVPQVESTIEKWIKAHPHD